MALGYTRQESRQELSRSSPGGKNQSHTVCSWPWSAEIRQHGTTAISSGRWGAVRRTAAALAYLAGLEGIPWRGGCRWNPSSTGEGPSELAVERDVSESGSLYAPWCVEGYGELVLSTASLMERTRPYQLPIELRAEL